MDLDLNQGADFPNSYYEAFEDDIFGWDGNYDEHHNVEQERELPTDHRNAHEDILQSTLHNDEEMGESSQANEDEGEEEILESSHADEDVGEHGDINSSLTSAIERRLSPGEKLDSLGHAYLLYCEYGRLKGFSVRKGTQKYYNQTDKVCKKDFNCSCHGKRRSKQLTERLHHYRKRDCRSGCLAMLRLVRLKDGRWNVTKLIKEHNHELADPKLSYLLRSARNMSCYDKSLLEALNSAGIRINDACRFMQNESGGPENMGFIRKDAYHHMDKVRMKSKLDDADSKSLLNHFMEKSNKEHDFYWNLQTDDEGRILNFFFRDTRSALDYDFFGDVLSVDTTYKTNKYDLICAPFVGVNHHMKNCLFGLAFISDETTATFEWLFASFLESMHGKEPSVVFTDQCIAMYNAIDSQFKSSTHRLCQWHINQNAPSYFGKVKNDKDFLDLWFLCMNGCETEEELENTWKKMMVDYDLGENHWFNSMYKLRKRWCSVFSQEKFCAGLHATSRSEVTNSVLKEISSRSGSLYDFVMKYERKVLEWRETEGVDDTGSLGVPGLFVAGNPILKQVAKYFTRTVFLSYEYEATRTINVDIISEYVDPKRGYMVEFGIYDVETPTRKRRVTYNRMTAEASCTCYLWQKTGVLCSHIFKILYHHNQKVIPPKYFMRRLSKEAKRRRATDVILGRESSSGDGNRREILAFNSHVMRSTYDLLHEISLDSSMKSHLLKGLETLREELLSMCKEGGREGRRVPVANFKNTVEILACRDPVVPQDRRFTNTRLSRHWEKPKRKGKKKGEPEPGTRLNIPIPRRNPPSSSQNNPKRRRANSPATSKNTGEQGDDFISSETRHVFTSRSDQPNFYATQ